MKGDYLHMKRNAFIRALCVTLCAALFLGTFTISFSAVNAESDPPAVAAAAVVQAEDDEPSFFAKVLGFVFRTFGFIGFTLDPYQFTIINQTPTFQWLLGFNDFYDMFPWVMNVWTDHFTCQFEYDNKDWRIQFWKGGYALFLATGGEIGIYNKTWGIEHYACPVDQSDWMFLEYKIYNKGKHLFTRPSPRLDGDGDIAYWWATGYKILSLCTDFFSKPRANVVMEAALPFQSVAMRTAFINALPSEFKPLEAGRTLSLSTPERYTLGTMTTKRGEQPCVRFVWQYVSTGVY